MALEIRWSKAAVMSFDKIVSHLLKDWGENTTKSFIKKAYIFLNILKEFPEIGTIENSEKNIRGFVLSKNVTVFYKTKGELVIILNFYDNRKRRKR